MWDWERYNEKVLNKNLDIITYALEYAQIVLNMLNNEINSENFYFSY